MKAYGRDRFRAISVYVHSTHAILALASVVAPVVALTLTPSPLGVTVAMTGSP